MLRIKNQRVYKINKFGFQIQESYIKNTIIKKQHIINNILVRIELKLETMFFFLSYLNG